MLKEITHVGVCVSDLERSIEFYRDVLGLELVGKIMMDGPETEALFGGPMIRARIAYMRDPSSPESATVELTEFEGVITEKIPMSLFRTGLSELCFRTDDIVRDTNRLMQAGVEFLSAPQDFDFRYAGFNESRAVYFRDPDGTVIELMEYTD